MPHGCLTGGKMPYTILLVDDDERLLAGMKRVLKKDGYRLLFSRSGNDALQKLETKNADMVISDYQMPGINGIEFLKQVKGLYPDMLTIMMTGLEDVKVAMQAINEAGVYKFLLKPFGTEMLRITVKRAVETLELMRERDALLEKVKARDALLNRLEKDHPGITQVKRDKDGFIVG